jgi:predicted CoA-binding protein
MTERVNRAVVEDFIGQKNLAIVGVSSDPHKFGNVAYHQLKKNGYHVFPINKNRDRIDGDICYNNLQALPKKVDGVIIVVPPQQTEQVVHEVEDAGIPRVWMQQGAESQEAIHFCQEHGIKEVHGECILMFAAPVKSVHKLHRMVRSVFGRLPK